jgi:hypothetical protein
MQEYPWWFVASVAFGMLAFVFILAFVVRPWIERKKEQRLASYFNHSDNDPIILIISEDLGRSIGGAVEIMGLVEPKFASTKFFRKLNLDICHKCGRNSFSFTPDKSGMILCAICKQRYTAILPNGTIWNPFKK